MSQPVEPYNLASDREFWGLLGGIVIGCAFLLVVMVGCAKESVHEVPAKCRGKTREQIEAAPPIERIRCAAHFFARAVSLGKVDACQDLRQLADLFAEPEVQGLAKKWCPVPR